MNVLISLHRGYGLGDAVQMSSVLRHVAEYRPNWTVDYRAEEGKHQVGRGIVASTFAYGEPSPSDYYDAEVEICLYDTWANWGDRPNTRVSSCLHERFGLGWDAECGQYRVDVSRDVGYAAQELMSRLTAARQRLTTRTVAVHYRGDSSPDKKNLTHRQADEICRHISYLGYFPLVLSRASIPKMWDGSAEMCCALISQCAAFVGIDSGPSKCASATDTPALVIWTGHHPAPFHDPAPNTTHLVPVGYHGLEPVCNDAGVVEFFESNYAVKFYAGDLVVGVKSWLGDTLTS